MDLEKVTSYNLMDVSQRELFLLANGLAVWQNQLTDGKETTITLAREIDALRTKLGSY